MLNLQVNPVGQLAKLYFNDCSLGNPGPSGIDEFPESSGIVLLAFSGSMGVGDLIGAELCAILQVDFRGGLLNDDWLVRT